jgi:hypothetical protein
VSLFFCLFKSFLLFDRKNKLFLQLSFSSIFLQVLAVVVATVVVVAAVVVVVVVVA